MSGMLSIYKSVLGLNETTYPSISSTSGRSSLLPCLGGSVPIQDISHHQPNDVKLSGLQSPSSSSTLDRRDDYSEWVRPGLSE